MPLLSVDVHPSLTVKTPIRGVALAAIDRRVMLGDLLMALARERRPQLVKTFEIVSMQDLSGGARDS